MGIIREAAAQPVTVNASPCGQPGHTATCNADGWTYCDQFCKDQPMPRPPRRRPLDLRPRA